MLKKKIAVFCIFRDSEKNLNSLLPRLLSLETDYNSEVDFSYFFFENDSIDRTVDILKKFSQGRDCVVESRKFNAPRFGSVADVVRVMHLSAYRNACKELAKNREFDYALCIDGDISFTSESLKMLLNEMVEGVVMACPNIRQNIPDLVHGSSETSYYDAFAIRDKYGNQGVYWSDCPLPMENCRLTWSLGLPVEVEAAFGGFCLINWQAFADSRWAVFGAMCEHVTFCKDVGKWGKIVIVPRCIVSTEVDLKRVNLADMKEKGKVQKQKIQEVNEIYQKSLGVEWMELKGI